MIEPGPDPPATLDAVRAFWGSHINNEYYTGAPRATAAYFDEIERRRYRWHAHLRELLDELRGRSGRLLEVGCGIGVDSVHLARCGFDVTAIDLTEEAIEVARAFARRRAVSIDFRVGNAESLEFPDASFDALYSFGVLHHTPDIERAVGEVRRVLRPGGTAHVMLYHARSLVHLVHWLLRLPYESPRDRKDQCPVVYTFTRKEARALFSGFSDVEIRADYPFTYGFRRVVFWIPRPAMRLLGRRIGWHLMIRAAR